MSRRLCSQAAASHWIELLATPWNRLSARTSATCRVHTGGDSAQAAGDVNAKAFTSGQDIHFGEGQYQPGTREGQKLLAHELTHTIQQRSGQAAVQSRGVISQPGEPLEREA